MKVIDMSPAEFFMEDKSDTTSQIQVNIGITNLDPSNVRISTKSTDDPESKMLILHYFDKNLVESRVYLGNYKKVFTDVLTMNLQKNNLNIIEIGKGEKIHSMYQASMAGLANHHASFTTEDSLIIEIPWSGQYSEVDESILQIDRENKTIRLENDEKYSYIVRADDALLDYIENQNCRIIIREKFSDGTTLPYTTVFVDNKTFSFTLH